MTSNAPARIALTNLGCRVNRVELDGIADELIAVGCEITNADEAEVIVINSCAVTGEAEAKTRKAIRHASGIPNCKLVVATGCVASLFADELKSLGNNIEVVANKSHVAAFVCEHLGIDSLHAHPLTDSERVHAIDGAVTPTGRMRPGLKIQDGCDNRCTYCIVWKARGSATSAPVSEVLDSVQKLINSGAKEVVLTGIDLGRYEYDGVNLAKLLDTLLDKTSIGRLRISSCEPAGVTPELLRVMSNSEGRVAPFLHVPLQSGCDATLKRMNRPYTAAEYTEIISRARESVPGLAVACDLIVGFPGETDEEFNESLGLCSNISFDHMHVFRYSKRPGTPAATMPNQVEPTVSAQRSLAMRELSRKCRESHAQALVGMPQRVLIERNGLATTGGLYEVRIDEGHVGELVDVVPHCVDKTILDARST